MSEERKARLAVLSRREAARCIRRAQRRGERVVFTSGCYDLLHVGHVRSFEAGEDARMLIGSADLMPRNLDRRVEVLVPVLSARVRQELNAVLDSAFADNTSAWELSPDGTWSRLSPGPGEKPHSHQAVMQRRARARAKRARDARARP